MFSVSCYYHRNFLDKIITFFAVPIVGLKDYKSSITLRLLEIYFLANVL